MKKLASGCLLFCAITLSIAFTGCRPFQSLEYKGLSDWEVEPKNFVESKLAVKAHLFNPNKHSVTVKRLEAAIDVNGSTWSTYRLDSNFTVPGNAETQFPLVLTVKNSHLLSGLSGLASGKVLPYQFKGKIKGTYRSISEEVPFTYSGTFSEKDISL